MRKKTLAYRPNLIRYPQRNLYKHFNLGIPLILFIYLFLLETQEKVTLYILGLIYYFNKKNISFKRLVL